MSISPAVPRATNEKGTTKTGGREPSSDSDHRSRNQCMNEQCLNIRITER
jgi:hypothetical protein